MFKKILLGYSRNQGGRDAAVLAEQLAGLSGGELEVVYPYHPLLATKPAKDVEREVRAELSELLGASPALAQARYRWSNSSWPIRALHELAECEEAETIVVGSTPSGFERRHVSTLERLVHGAPCTVALAPASFSAHPRRMRWIGVGFADTEEGRAALMLARWIAERSGASLRVLAGSGLSPMLQSYAAASPDLPAAEAEMQSELKVAAYRVCEELLAGVDYEIDVRRGDPCQLLVHASEDLDMLVLGSRVYGPLRRALLGSVSAAVMRASSCPVIVAPRGASVDGAPSARASTAIGV
ncbi:MAG TPA: universal stress protein [Solirubrobacteraceae bacterium]|nr:universal stress protein [Solirubrobacteraceae bacterium]